MDSLPKPKDAQRIINDTAREARHAHQTRANTMHYNQGVPPNVAAGLSTATPLPEASAPDPMAQLRQLGELRDAGVLTDAEFDAKKADILGRM